MDGDGWRLSFGRCFEDHVALGLRRGQAKRFVRAAFWPRARIEWRALNEAFVILAPDCGPDSVDLADLMGRLVELAKRPLTPKELLAVLPLTNKERVRWTKDGRLTPSGSVSIRKGQIVSVPTYSVSQVERLLGAPQVICDWREEDARLGKDGH
ncbi:hypothetical protein QUC32_04145 [Novosphingobium resinovorum]|uniref:hypothetical protein n=1 Tax=Sphingomonadaceae TaxID=41297 RepID=UPI00155E2C13|nr:MULTISPECIES: hypothetical protein [Sphingomonadaceae]MBF7014007.1 hypothetical protein [Novosphingobium sp. HR1a]WJM26149.1 hypothetical protein QUC32_04145 [Novosphingobium resinovorum]